MFEIFMMAGWVLFGILLLYLWADVRELKKDLKGCRRDLMRNQLGGRTSDGYPGFSEEQYWKEAREEADREQEAKSGQASAEGTAATDESQRIRRKTVSLKPGEEQVLREILTEFLS